MLKNDFRPGLPIAAIPADWLNHIADILNNIRVEVSNEQFPRIERTTRASKNSPWRILIPPSGGAAGEALVEGALAIVDEDGDKYLVQKWTRLTFGAGGVTVERDVVLEDEDVNKRYATRIKLYPHTEEHADGVIKATSAEDSEA